MEGYAEAFALGLLAPPEDGRVVASDLGRPCPVGSRPVEFFQYEGGDGADTVVHPHWKDIDAESVLLGRVKPQLSTGAEEERSNIHGGTGGVGRHIGGVERDGEVAAPGEVVEGDLRDGDERGRVSHALCVHPRPEDVDLTFGVSEGFETLIALLACRSLSDPSQ